MEPFLERTQCPRDHRTAAEASIVSHTIAAERRHAALNFYASVSSVKTLEEAKTTKGCLYMQMPVQEVNTIVFERHNGAESLFDP